MPEVTTTQAASYFPLSEGLDEHASEALAAPMALPLATAATIGSRRPRVSDDLRAELEYVVTMRQRGQQFVASQLRISGSSLLLRLSLAVSIVTAITVCGLLLFVVALLDVPMRPNPYVAFTLLLVGLALAGTVATALRGGPPRSHRR